MGPYSLTYNFNPNDLLWVLDGDSVKKATCLQVDIKIVPTTTTTFTTIINYIVLLDCNAGTMTVSQQNAYSSLDQAIAALQTYMANKTC